MLASIISTFDVTFRASERKRLVIPWKHQITILEYSFPKKLITFKDSDKQLMEYGETQPKTDNTADLYA